MILTETLHSSQSKSLQFNLLFQKRNRMKKLLMECLGTFFFVLTIIVTGNALAIAAMLMAWVYIGGYVSGGHYNPAVSLAVALRGRLSREELLRYMGAQIVGGFAAYLIAAFIGSQIVLPAPGTNVTLLQAFVVEILLAFVLALVVLTVATSERFKGSQVFGVAIGFTIPALAILGSPISGGLFNPAIALGAAFFGLINGLAVIWPHVLMYVAGALIGGFLAAYTFHHFGLDEKR